MQGQVRPGVAWPGRQGQACQGRARPCHAGLTTPRLVRRGLALPGWPGQALPAWPSWPGQTWHGPARSSHASTALEANAKMQKRTRKTWVEYTAGISNLKFDVTFTWYCSCVVGYCICMYIYMCTYINIYMYIYTYECMAMSTLLCVPPYWARPS